MINNDLYTDNELKLYNEVDRKNICEYLNQLSNKEKQVYIIAKQHLGSSFNLLKSNGYCKWMSNK